MRGKGKLGRKASEKTSGREGEPADRGLQFGLSPHLYQHLLSYEPNQGFTG